MKNLLKIFLVLVVLTGCKEKEKTQYNLVIMTEGGEVKYAVENAVTPEQLETGLMFRDKLDADKGMIFKMPRLKHTAMWMKNTKIGLDMIFLDDVGQVVWIYENAVPYSLQAIEPPMEIGYVLEVNAGDVRRKGVKEGDMVRHEFFNEMDEPALSNLEVISDNVSTDFDEVEEVPMAVEANDEADFDFLYDFDEDDETFAEDLGGFEEIDSTIERDASVEEVEKIEENLPAVSGDILELDPSDIETEL